MKVDEAIQIQKFLLMLFNSFFMILGFSIFGCAAWILFDRNSFIVIISSESEVKLVSVSLAVIGLVVIVVSLLGCVGGQLENKFLLMIYMGFLIIIALGQIFVTMILLVRRNKIEEFLVNEVNNTIRQYGSTETAYQASLLDKVQHSAKCCGRLNPTEWNYNEVILSFGEDNVYPCSCFNNTCPVYNGTYFGVGTNIYSEGCQDVLTRWLEDNIFVIIGMALGLIFVQIFQFSFAVLIFQNLGRKMKLKHPKSLIASMEVDPQTETVYQDSNPDYNQQQYHQEDYQQQHYHQSDYQHQQYQQEDYQQQHYHQSDYQHQQYHPQDYHQQKQGQYNQNFYKDLQYQQPDSFQQHHSGHQGF